MEYLHIIHNERVPNCNQSYTQYLPGPSSFFSFLCFFCFVLTLPHQPMLRACSLFLKILGGPIFQEFNQ